MRQYSGSLQLRRQSFCRPAGLGLWARRVITFMGLKKIGTMTLGPSFGVFDPIISLDQLATIRIASRAWRSEWRVSIPMIWDPVFLSLFARDMFQNQDFHSFEYKIWGP